MLKEINKKWRRKKVLISFLTFLSTAIILLGVYAFLFYFERVIPYSKNLIKIEMQNGNQLVSHYYGESYATFTGTHPLVLEIDGEKRNVSFIFYTETFADSPTRDLIKDNKNTNGQDHIFPLPESEKIDAVYYVDYD